MLSVITATLLNRILAVFFITLAHCFIGCLIGIVIAFDNAGFHDEYLLFKSIKATTAMMHKNCQGFSNTLTPDAAKAAPNKQYKNSDVIMLFGDVDKVHVF